MVSAAVAAGASVARQTIAASICGRGTTLVRVESSRRLRKMLLDARMHRCILTQSTRTESPMDIALIQSDPDVMLGKPVVRGTRITVELILRKLSCGESIEQILESHPRLTREAILAALGYAAEAMGHETVHAVGDRKSA